MLGPGRYMLGVLEILLLGGFAWLGGTSARKWLLPRFEGAPAHLVSAVIALALLIWAAELLGSFGWLEPVPYLVLVGVLGAGTRVLRPAGPVSDGTSPPGGGDPPSSPPAGDTSLVPTLIALLVAIGAAAHFAAEAKTKLSTGMTGFDSTWYHGPFAFDRDVLSPLLSLGWFAGCLVACWCIGRPYRVAPWSLALGAIALSVPALADQAGEARNDIVGIFFLLAGVAVMANAWGGDGGMEKKLGREGGGSG